MKKAIVASFIIFSFIGYSLVESPLIKNPTLIPTVTAPPKPLQSQQGKYKDGQYTGVVTDAYYGNIQVKAVINNGHITDVIFLDYPQSRGQSIEINNYAMPILTSETIKIQSANIDIVSGATATSQAFIQSLQSALNQAV